ncbi:protocadherin-10-like isoform X3 [Scyliorhinus canicula]|uniref:protocadherin-10-like isoform X3 n=1 Tax=Scyliorhinus canicula TaxID=7830 RepID=UPI0018F3011A|nr:protocadherin-10-like isoform X3 [Scyliorhinus canicula]
MSLSSNEVLKCKLREGGVGAYPSSRPPSSTLHSTGAREEQSSHQQQPVQHIGRGRQSEWRIGNSRCGHSPSGFIQDPDPRPQSASLTPKSLWAHPWVEQPLVPAGRQRGDMANSPWRGRWKSLMLFFCRLVSILDGASGQIRYSIPEELKHGAFVGNIADDLGLNVAELSARRFRIVPSARRHYLEVNLENGILFVNEKIDREAVCGLNAACFLSLEVVIESPLELYQAEIEILDVNDNPPAFPSTQVKLDITESAAPGSRFPLESAQDPDVGTNSLRTYRLSPNEHFVLEVQTRSERSKIPELILERSLDRERQTVHRLLLTALDGGVPERSGSVRIAIHVVDANDNAPVFERPVYTVRVAENAPRGTLLIQLNASDLDEGTNGRIAYSLGSHAHGTVRELFSVDPHTGQVRVKGGLDYEGGPVHEVYVQAKDLGPNAVAAHCNVIVEVEDVNDNRPEIVLTSLSSPVPEDASPGTVIALISVTDRDTGANGRVSCRLTGSPPFKLLPSFRKYFTLVTERRLDRELVPEYNVTVAARDGGSPPLSSSRTIRVKVSDVNDNAPRFSRASYTVYVMENNAPGASICSVTAEDPDANQNSYLSYSILEGQVQGMPVSTYVSVNSDTGSLYALRSFDFEQLRKFRVQIRAQDAGFTPLSSNCTINILILDQNDNGPVIVAPLPRNGSVAAETVPRWAAAGHLAVRVTAVDADQGANARLSYRLLRATERGLFKLDVHTGEIRMARPFGPRDSPQQSLVLQAQDGGVPPLSATLTILLTAVDRVPEPRAEPDRDSQLNSDLTLYLIISLGSISFLFLLAILLLALARWHRHRLHADGCSPLACCPAARRRNTAHIFQKPDVNLQLAAGAQGAAIGSGEFPTCGEFPACRLPSQAYRYKVCLTPESAKSDFMFLRPCGPATPPNNNPLQGCHVRVAGGSGLSAATKAPTEVKQQNTDYPPFQRNVGFSSREPEETGIRNDGQTESGKVRSAVTTPTGLI